MQEIARYDELKIPAYALPYLINNDSSGLDEQDIANIDNYMHKFYTEAELIFGHLIFDTMESESESYFTWNPAFGLSCDVVDCVILIVKA